MRGLGVITLALVAVMGIPGVALAGNGNGKDNGKGPSSKGLDVGQVADFYGNAVIWTDKATYRVGENVRIGIKSSVDGYAAIYDHPTSGPSHMIWPKSGSPEFIRAGRTYSVPDGKFSLTASEPLGTDRLVLVVSRAKANLTVTFNIGLVFGLGSRGLTTDGQGSSVSSATGNGESIYSECSFAVTPRYTKPVLRIYGGAGARLFIDGNDYGQVSGGQLNLEPGTNEVVALLPGMRVESRSIGMRDNLTYDWSLRFSAVR